MRRIFSVILLCSILVTLCSCGNEKNTVTDAPTDTVSETDKETDEITDDRSYDTTYGPITDDTGTRDPEFGIEPHVCGSKTVLALKLLKLTAKTNENVVLSPLSIQIALAMTAEGANGDTRTELSDLMGGENALAQLPNYISSLSSKREHEFHIANSLWLRDDFLLNDEFSSAIREKYGARCESRKFNDNTKNEINGWIDENTDGLIKDTLRDISSDNVMYLINALVLNAEWMSPLTAHEGAFENAYGEKQDVKTLTANDHTIIFENSDVKGFKTAYKGGSSFVALMPDKGIALSEYIGSLDEDKLKSIFASGKEGNAEFPAFKSEFEVELSELLKKMGVTAPFDKNKADLSKMLKYPSSDLVVSNILHKSAVEINAYGVHAAASTIVTVVPTSTPMQEIKKSVVVDRPFIYMITDENDVPLFVGTVNSIE